jgi:hypothetical protein
MGRCDTTIGRADPESFSAKQEMGWRAKPAAEVREALWGGGLNLIEDCQRAAEVAGGAFKFTVTNPYLLARTLLDFHYHDFEQLPLALADVLAAQVSGCPCPCLQVDEANIPVTRTTARSQPRPSTRSSPTRNRSPPSKENRLVGSCQPGDEMISLRGPRAGVGGGPEDHLNFPASGWCGRIFSSNETFSNP